MQRIAKHSYCILPAAAAALLWSSMGFLGCAPDTDGINTTGGTSSNQNNTAGLDALPAGAISFFNSGACPTGWTPFAEGAGRVLVPTVGADPALVATGEPLLDGEERMHGHGMNAEVDLNGVSYAGVAGEANHGVAAQQKTVISGAMDKASAGLPYVQLLVCKKLSAKRIETAKIPRGLLMFWNGAQCPEGFSQPIATQGRYMVGLPEGAAAGLSFGGTSLKSEEIRTHKHDIQGTLTTTSHGIALASGCCADGYAQNAEYPFSGASDEIAADMPAITLLQCEKM